MDRKFKRAEYTTVDNFVYVCIKTISMLSINIIVLNGCIAKTIKEN